MIETASPGFTGIRCPRCSNPLMISASRAACAACQQTFKQLDGALILSETSYYFGEIDQPAMRRHLEEARRDGWTASMERLGQTTSSFAFHYATDPGRANWRMMLPLDKQSSVLDLGCGWGSLAVPLAEVSGRVVAADATPERVQSLGLRARELNLHNLLPLCITGAPPLPFNDAAFDLVVLNGVLEWVGESNPMGNPRQAQLALLREIRRILKPSGALYIGIENRIGYQYFIGAEDHGGLRFTSLMPRRLASLVTRWKQHRPYRTYTYSGGGYLRLLEEAGYGTASVAVCLPDYREIRVILPWKQPALHRYFGKHLFPALASGKLRWQKTFRTLFDLVAASGLSSAVAPHFSILASEEKDGPRPFSYAENFLRRSWHGLPFSAPVPDKFSFLQLNTKRLDNCGKAVVFVFSGASTEPLAVLRFPLTPGGRRSLENDLTRREAAREQAPPFRIPRLHFQGEIGPYWGSLEEVASGRSLVENLRLQYSPSRLRRALTYAVQLQTRWLLTCEKPRTAEAAAGTIAMLEGSMSQLLQGSPDQTSLVNGFKRALEKLSSGPRGPAYLHNDWHLQNIYVHNGSPWVLDWEMATGPGPAGLDSAHLLLQTSRELPEQRDTSLAAAIDSLRSPGHWYGALSSSLLRGHLTEIGLDPALWPAAVAGAVAVRAAIHKDPPESRDKLQAALRRLLKGDPA